jgi:hypothetical protein
VQTIFLVDFLSKVFAEDVFCPTPYKHFNLAGDICFEIKIPKAFIYKGMVKYYVLLLGSSCLNNMTAHI